MDAVQAAVDMQKALDLHNRQSGRADRIQVKIGINWGEALVDAKDVFGDAVNVAARIQAKAGPDEILVSQDVYNLVCGSEDVLCRFHDTSALKGKAQPVNLYRVVWRDEAVDFQEHRTRAGLENMEHRDERPLVFHIDVARERGRVKICAYEENSGETTTLRHYEEVSVSMETINQRCLEIVDLLNRANRMGRVSRDTLLKLRSIGQVLTDEFFTSKVKERLAATDAEYLVINLDDQLVQVPWELFHDGRQFLCRRFCMGRLVRTRQEVSPIRSRRLGSPLRMLVLADPRGDLKGAYSEGQKVITVTDGFKGLVNATLKSDGITIDYIRSRLRNFDVVHYAGHSDFYPEDAGGSGWRLSRGTLQARDVSKMAGTGAMPALIFSNACQSARTEEWSVKQHFQDEIFGLANAFLLSGVKHYVGTFWEILDEPSSRFARAFYEKLFSGLTVGRALCQARSELIEVYGEETIVWGSYVLYGDPAFNYMEQITDSRVTEEPKPAPDRKPEPERVGLDGLRTGEEVISFESRSVSGKRIVFGALVVLLVMLLGAGLWLYPAYMKQKLEEIQNQARTEYLQGRYDAALETSNMLVQKNADLRLPYVIRGDIAFRNGRLDDARNAYERAVEASEGLPSLTAHALVGLGRIASMQGDRDRALDFYEQASAVDPESLNGVVSQAVLLEQGGEYERALALLDRARGLDSADHTLSALASEMRKRVELAQDRERRQLDELVARANEPPRADAWDGWTSRPLTVWIMDLETDGYSLHEGESRLLTAGLTEALLDAGPARVVERALLEKLLNELKLGASDLADRNTALSMGRILAARLILTGKLAHKGAQTEAALRLIETETGRIVAAHSDAFPAAAGPGDMAASLAPVMVEKMGSAFPLRGAVTGLDGDNVIINIGSEVGVEPGMKFALTNVDSTLEIVTVDRKQSLARVSAGEKDLFQGLRCEVKEWL